MLCLALLDDTRHTSEYLCSSPIAEFSPRAPLRIKRYFYPALRRKYGEIAGPYVVQTDQCRCIAKGFDDFNAEMGFEAVRVIFRGRDENDPKARCDRSCLTRFSLA